MKTLDMISTTKSIKNAKTKQEPKVDTISAKLSTLDKTTEYDTRNTFKMMINTRIDKL